MALAINETSVSLVWQASPNTEANYTVTYSHSNGLVVVQIVTGNGLEVHNLPPGDYTFQITTMVGGETSSVALARFTAGLGGGLSSKPL